jgi:hypothetical protein
MAFLDKIFMCAFIFLLLFSIIGSTMQHELAHKMFNDKFGLKSEYFMNLPWTVGVRTFGEQPGELKILHGMNEVVAYNLTPYLLSLIAIIGCGFWFIGNKLDCYYEVFKTNGITITQLPPEKNYVELEGVEVI